SSRGENRRGLEGRSDRPCEQQFLLLEGWDARDGWNRAARPVESAVESWGAEKVTRARSARQLVLARGGGGALGVPARGSRLPVPRSRRCYDAFSLRASRRLPRTIARSRTALCPMQGTVS